MKKDLTFPKDWTTAQKIDWLKGNVQVCPSCYSPQVCIYGDRMKCRRCKEKFKMRVD